MKGANQMKDKKRILKRITELTQDIMIPAATKNIFNRPYSQYESDVLINSLAPREKGATL